MTGVRTFLRSTASARVAVLLALALAPTLAPAATAQQPAGGPAAYDTSFLAGLKWRQIGPERGGRSLAIAGSAGRPDEYWFGAVGGGLWKTTDGGLTWKPVTDGQLGSSSVGAVGVAESNPDVVYIGMGETELRGNIMQGDGVYRTTDGGKTWTHIGLEDTEAIARVRVDPTNPDRVFVAALGHPYGPNPERGVFRTLDGGKSWTKVLFESDSAGAADLIIDPSNPATIYATTWQVYRTPWKMWGGGPHSKLFRSTDGGDHWTDLTSNPGMPARPIGKIGITVSPTDPSRLYAIVEANDGGVFRSDDAGATWRRVNDERKIRQRSFYYSHIYADPKSPDVVYALNTSLYRSKDGGKTFETMRGLPHGDQHDLWIAPDDPQRLASANDGGGTISTNGGSTWTEQDFPTAQLYHITTTSDVPYHVCGAQQDNSTVCVPSGGWDFMQARGPNHGWYYAVGGGESGYIAQSPTDPDVFFAGSQGALLTRVNRRTGQERDVQPDPRFFSGEPASALPERWQWTFPIVFSPVDHALYTTSQHVWKSTDEGQTWTRISPDLTRNDPKTLGMSGGLITMDMNGPEIYGTVFALAPSYSDASTIWAGSDDGLVHITRDGGAHWTDVTPPDVPRYTRIVAIDASRHDPATAYVAGTMYQLDDRRPYLWRTHDYGRTWTKIVSGIGDDDITRVIREDVVRPRMLYAGTESGVYVSWDDGDHWQPLSLNLPSTQVADLVVEAHDLVAGTHGRSIWVLDDIDPLRQLSTEIAAAHAWLFQPNDAVRGIDNGIVQYWLEAPADSVAIEIVDSAGKAVRRLASVADSAKSDEDDNSFRRGPEPPTTRAGLNRVEWDLRYPGAVVFDSMIIWSARPQAGPKAPPGTYRVRLVVNGRPVSEPRTLAVEMDPRLQGVTVADLRDQFELAMRIRDRTSAADQAVIGIRDLRAQVQDRLEKAADPALEKAAAAFLSGIAGVEQNLYQVRNRSGQDPLNFPIKLNNRLAALRRSVETGDARPTAGAYRVLEQLSAELDRELATLSDLIEQRLPELNRRFADKGLAPVTPRSEMPGPVADQR